VSAISDKALTYAGAESRRPVAPVLFGTRITGAVTLSSTGEVVTVEVWLSGLVVPLLLFMLKGTYTRAAKINPKVAAEAVWYLVMAALGGIFTVPLTIYYIQSPTLPEGYELSLLFVGGLTFISFQVGLTKLTSVKPEKAEDAKGSRPVCAPAAVADGVASRGPLL
jgi:hypothetical protein